MTSFESTRFNELKHPFVWTTAEERSAVLANVNEPIWHRFIEEAEKHFEQIGGLPLAKFPVFCHRGDLDEVMAVCVLATVRDDAKLWHWIGDWLRGALSYYRLKLPQWRENRYAIMRGEQPQDRPEGGGQPKFSGGGNPRQFFEGFTEGITYWVEAGLTSVLFHLLDQLEAYAPNELNAGEKLQLLEAIGDYADRFAFHEERMKYNNRGMWANAAIMLAGLARLDRRTGDLLALQAARRHEEYRSTFLDDGFHIEGAPDYHLMSCDGMLAYLLTAANLAPDTDVYAGNAGSGAFERYPSFHETVRAYLHTVVPGPTLWNHSRGCSISSAVTIRPAVVNAWRLSQDEEIGWLLGARMGEVDTNSNKTPLKVTNTALLGLGHYQPLLNFWLFRPVPDCAAPKTKYHNMDGYGTVFSRSHWGRDASCVSVRYGYEGTGKGHRDHAHVALSVAGVNVLKDPFPRYGPAGLNTAMYHNTVVIDNQEPSAVVGSVLSEQHEAGGDALLIDNVGGGEPDRIFLGDPCEETNYWFTNHPEIPESGFLRAVIHIHDSCVILVDEVRAEGAQHIDWFFHSDLSTVGYERDAEERQDSYQARQRMVVVPAGTVDMSFRGTEQNCGAGDVQRFEFEAPSLDASFSQIHSDAEFSFARGHHVHVENASLGSGLYSGEQDFYIRARAQVDQARVCWASCWGAAMPQIEAQPTAEGYQLTVKEESVEWHVSVDFTNKQVVLSSETSLAER
ncbi:heparinase II/III family protein [Coraliomargarita algicola]|uniref:Heparinase II/III family protein n=1 Tax=Coraliomargarita algicola TaxID=3092156 RepID=A0ABZ0RKJ8_9BACT|nr:heparinase II/III family protein [Coraliomargarita sp. J2-16]WPJ95618.1 heparinase II/III family protein [Coraliomargarita sp. J2-16]